MKRLSPKTRFRVFFLSICLMISFSFFVYTLFSNFSQILNNIAKINNLNNEYSLSLETGKNFEDEKNKSQDPEYRAKSIREKNLYSAQNEIILKFEE